MARRTKDQAEETREKLLEAALVVMSKKTFASVSMSEIAEEAGVTRGAIYWHFKNKNDILVHLIERLSIQMEEDFLKNGENMTTWESLRHYFRHKVTELAPSERCTQIFEVIGRRREWPQDIQKQIFSYLEDRIAQEHKIVEDTLVGLQKAGKIRSDIVAAELSTFFIATFHGLFAILQMEKENAEVYSRYTNFFFDAFEAKLRPE